MKWAKYKNVKLRQMDIISAFSQIDLKEYEKLLECGKYVYSATCSNCGQKHFAGFSRCRSRFCIPCSRVTTMQYAAKILQVYDESTMNMHFLTLTLRNYHDLSKMLDDVNFYWRQFYHDDKDFRCWWKGRFKGGLRRTEIKHAQDGTWHVHMHLLLITNKEFNKDYDIIKYRWKSVTCDNGSCFIKRVSDPVRGILETVKYMCDITKLNVTDMKSVYDTIKGRRLISTFGILRGIKEDDKDYDEDALKNFICSRCGCTRAYLESVLAATLLDDEIV